MLGIVYRRKWSNDNRFQFMNIATKIVWGKFELPKVEYSLLTHVLKSNILYA